jgi:hypothetical protein
MSLWMVKGRSSRREGAENRQTRFRNIPRLVPAVKQEGRDLNATRSCACEQLWIPTFKLSKPPVHEARHPTLRRALGSCTSYDITGNHTTGNERTEAAYTQSHFPQGSPFAHITLDTIVGCKSMGRSADRSTTVVLALMCIQLRVLGDRGNQGWFAQGARPLATGMHCRIRARRSVNRTKVCTSLSIFTRASTHGSC